MKKMSKMLKTVMEAAENKKAYDIKVYDISNLSGFWDFMVVCTAGSSVHCRAIYDYIEDELKKEGFTVYYKDRANDSGWMVLDCGEIIVHVFEKDTRNYYAVEKLWGGIEIMKGGKHEERNKS